MVIGWDIGIKNLAYCNINEVESTTEYDIEVNNKYFKILDWDTINLVKKLEEDTLSVIKDDKKKKKKSANKINLTRLGKILFEEFNTKPELLNCDIVLLENQPVFKNPTMKSVQMLVYSYFIMKGMIDGPTISDIKCYSASNKIKMLQFTSDEFQEELKNKLSNIKTKYTKNKKTAIALTEYFLDHESELYKKFSCSKKKDDLADSLLMSLHYLVKN